MVRRLNERESITIGANAGPIKAFMRKRILIFGYDVLAGIYGHGPRCIEESELHMKTAWIYPDST